MATRRGVPPEGSARGADPHAVALVAPDPDSDVDADTVIGPVRALLPDSGDDTIVRFPRFRPPSPVTTPVASVPEFLAYRRVRVNHGATFGLDAPIVIGRSPVPSRVIRGVAARLLTVASPRREVSSSHLRVQQEGSSVLVSDLRSTNGTVITRPGSVAATLPPGDSIVVLPGTVIDIGDGNVIEILGPEPTVRPHSDPVERPAR